jgi:ribosomal subunit interface protein
MAEAVKSASLKLGGNIELSGFNDVDPRSMIILKKIIGNYVRKFSDHLKDFRSIHLHLKEISKKQGNVQFELKAKVELGAKNVNAETTDRNIFVAVDSLLKKAEKELAKL